MLVNTTSWQRDLTAFLANAASPLIVILGPTASGKTSFSLQVAEFLHEERKHAEVINADSRQLYRSLDIGTAKITQEEMKGVPHHLLSVLDPDQEVTIAWYKKEAEKIIASLHHQKNVPLLTGGSMLYISAIIDGLSPASASDPALRSRLSDEYDQDAGVTLHRRLQEIDPESAQAIPRENKHYVIRALEIFELTGKKKSESKEMTVCPYDLFILGMDIPKEELHRRIDARIEKMFADGWINEVKELVKAGYDEHAPAMESHGYREIVAWITAGEDSATLNAVKEQIAKNTRQYVKRQLTWWKGDSRIQWVNA